jgi:hypothetical protein
MLSRFPFQRVCLGPIADGRLRLGQFVQHVDSDVAPRPRDGGRKPQSRRIDIAPHCPHRFKGTELVEHGLGSNVTGVEDFVDTVEKWREMRIKVSVRVRDHTNSHKNQESGVEAHALSIDFRVSVSSGS